MTSLSLLFIFFLLVLGELNLCAQEEIKGSNAKHAFFDVPAHIYHSSHRKELGAPGVYAGISRKF